MTAQDDILFGNIALDWGWISKELLGNARALLLPIQWPEPFGLAFVEALACGTPVITCPHGSAPEIVRDGVNGLLAEGQDGLVDAVRRVGDIDRAACRRDYEERFTVERMTDDYEAVYRHVLTSPALPRGEEMTHA